MLTFHVFSLLNAGNGTNSGLVNKFGHPGLFFFCFSWFGVSILQDCRSLLFNSQKHRGSTVPGHIEQKSDKTAENETIQKFQFPRKKRITKL